VFNFRDRPWISESGGEVYVEVEFGSQAVSGVLAILAHHDDRSLHGCKHGEEEVEQNEWIGTLTGR
jgi:hypothetical protein